MTLSIPNHVRDQIQAEIERRLLQTVPSPPPIDSLPDYGTTRKSFDWRSIMQPRREPPAGDATILERLGGFPQVQSAMSEGRTPPSGGSGITKTCAHDFVWLRTSETIRFENTAPSVTTRVAVGTDTFYCRHCLEYREVKR